MTALPDACDCQIHVFGDSARYPFAAGATYDVPSASVEDAARMHATIGIGRAVLVQASAYGTDNRLLVDTLRRLPPSRYVGVALIDDDVDGRELRRMHEAGVRGVRFNFARFLPRRPSAAEVERCLARVREYDWVVKIFPPDEGQAEVYHIFERTGLRVVVDHMGCPSLGRGMSDPDWQDLLRRLRDTENWWVMLSNGDRWSTQEVPPWSDVVPFGRALHEAAPDRSVWASDWPKLHYDKPAHADDATRILAESYLPDAAARRRVFVDNPARLFGFATVEESPPSP